MATASARHILVKTQEECKSLKEKIEAKEATFEEMAKKHSDCPSGSAGGNLGSFSKGQMVAEFDSVVFTKELNVVHGPVRTQFGYHLILITGRD